MYQALHATSITLRDFLEAQIRADSFLYAPMAPYRARSMVVSLNTPKEMQDNNQEGVSMWLYRVVRDDQRLNDPPLRISATQLRPAPLPLRLHYLVTPYTTRRNAGDPDTEQYLLGKIIQCLHTHPVMQGVDLHGELAGTTASMSVRLETLPLDEMSRIWDALDGTYQLSVSYEVSIVNIDSAREPDSLVPVVDVLAEIGQIVRTP